MTFPLLEVQTAIYDKLTGDSTLMALITGVYDHVPEGTVHPYVVIGETTATAENAHDRIGKDQVVTLHVWSKQHGFSEALEIAARICTVLEHQSLTVSGYDHVLTAFEFAQTLRDPDPEIRHVPVRFRILTSATV